MLVRTLILGASSLLVAGCGITGNFRNDPGYADFGSLKRLDSESDFGLSLGPLPLKIAAWGVSLSEDNEEIGTFLRELRAVRVYTFEGVEEDPEKVATDVKKVTAELAATGWLNVAAVREDSALTSVFLRPDKNFTHHGLVVIVQEPDEVVLVNLIGNIRLDFIDGYMADLDIDVPPIEIDPATARDGGSAANAGSNLRPTLQASALSRPASPAAEIDP
jgi:hypothetical protein